MNTKWIAAAIIIVVTIASIWLFTSDGGDDGSKINQASNSQSKYVSLNDLSAYEQSVLEGSVDTIQSNLYRKLAQNYTNPDQTYDAIIRENSLDVTFYNRQGSKVPQIQFLVDIPTAKRTYKVTLFGGPQYPTNILYILCPTADESNYGNFECSDE